MKKLILILMTFFICNAAYAGQYVYIGQGYTVNKNNIFYIKKLTKTDISIQSQSDNFNIIRLSYKSTEERDKAYNEIIKKLDQ